jgi:DNA-binding response OmpR family regulator
VKYVIDLATVTGATKGLRIDLIERSNLISKRFNGDPSRIRQILQNFLQNAVKHSPDRGSIQFQLSHCGAALRFTITDEGSGVPVSIRPKLFTATENQGLGLAIARDLARRMGGDIVFDEKYTDGAQFIVELCLTSPRENLDPKPLHGKSVLIAAAQFSVRAQLLAYAQLWNMKSQLCSNADDAMLCTRSMATYDLGWIDVMMPEKNGVELASDIKQNKPAMILIGMSEVGNDFNGAHLFNKIVPKPVNEYDLLDASAALFTDDPQTMRYSHLQRSDACNMCTLRILASSGCDTIIDMLNQHCTDIVSHTKVVTKVDRWLEQHNTSYWNVVIVHDTALLDGLKKYKNIESFIVLCEHMFSTTSDSKVSYLKRATLTVADLRAALMKHQDLKTSV